ncbi:MAG: hypothetical protein KAT16_01890 [Candidatus Heimdallarchaeota archaeon]|nr:hypothetical protein [Candidatus Heimdallarchaeota archaeon]
MGFQEIRGHGYCPFRVEIHNHMPGCVLRLGKETPCYSTDHQPLLLRNKEYTCPQLPEVIISEETYSDIEELVNYIFTIQDRENTCINLWPMLTGIGHSRNKATTPKGKAMEGLSAKVREKLDDIIFEMD